MALLDYLLDYIKKNPGTFKEIGTIVLGSTDCPIGFCKVNVPKHLEGDVSKLPLVGIIGTLGNSQNEGSTVQVNVGDKVWVEFQKTEAAGHRPLVVGSAYLAPDGLPNFPHDGFDGPLTLTKRHLIPRDENGEVHEDFEEPKKYVKGRVIAKVKEGISTVIQNGQYILTHLKTLSHFMFSESGSADLFSTKNLFIRARNNLHLWGKKISFRGNIVELDIDDLSMKLLNEFGIDAKQIILESGGIAKIIASAIQLVTSGDFIVSSQGKISQEAKGSSLTNVNQNLLTDPLRAWGARLNASGVTIAELGFEAKFGKIIAENLQGSIKGQMNRNLDQMSALIDEVIDAIIKTGTGNGIVSPQTRTKLLKIKIENAKIKAENSLIMQ